MSGQFSVLIMYTDLMWLEQCVYVLLLHYLRTVDLYFAYKVILSLVAAATSLVSTSGTIVTLATTVTIVTASMVSTVANTNLMICADPLVSQSGNNIITSIPVVSITMTPVVSSTKAADAHSSDDKSSSVEIIAGCIIGVVFCVTLLLVIILLWCYLRRRKGKLDVSQGESK